MPSVGVRAADYIHKIIGWSLIGFTVLGGANLASAFDFKLRRNRKAQQLLEEATADPEFDRELQNLTSKL